VPWSEFVPEDEETGWLGVNATKKELKLDLRRQTAGLEVDPQAVSAAPAAPFRRLSRRIADVSSRGRTSVGQPLDEYAVQRIYGIDTMIDR
jgi:hypothetical protein